MGMTEMYIFYSISLTLLQILRKFTRILMPEFLNIGVFASGRGSNFRAILESIKSGKIQNAQITIIISNNSGAGALQIARENNIPALHISRMQFTSDDDYANAILDALERYNVNFIALAGYMKKIDPRIIRKYKNRILNIHPALLPKYGGDGMYGIHVHEAVIASRDPVSGATVHMVDEEYDHGSIVLQKKVFVDPADTAESLAKKVLAVEHQIYPEVIRLFAEGKVIFKNGKTEILR
jgi:phosphoribosylglycinamide formyltransferase-1